MGRGSPLAAQDGLFRVVGYRGRILEASPLPSASARPCAPLAGWSFSRTQGTGRGHTKTAVKPRRAASTYIAAVYLPRKAELRPAPRRYCRRPGECLPSTSRRFPEMMIM